MFNQKSEPINDKEIIKCLDCQNKDICKYTEDMKDLYEYLFGLVAEKGKENIFSNMPKYISKEKEVLKNIKFESILTTENK